MKNRKYYLIICFITFFCNIIIAQTDTLFEAANYSIVKRFDNGKAKVIAQFKQDCNGHLIKHGQSITFNLIGEKTRTNIYCYDKLFNQKIGGLKFGYWGNCNGLRTKYFMGIRVSDHPYDPSPCL